jgi:hypothetical protein
VHCLANRVTVRLAVFAVIPCAFVDQAHHGCP